LADANAKTADANAKTADANAKTADANAKTANANAKTPAAGGSNTIWWVLGILAVIGIAVGGFVWAKKSGKLEGGQKDDKYERFIDNLLTE